MQGAIIKELSRLPGLNGQLTDCLRRLLALPLEQFSHQGSRSLLNTLIASTCQTRNLLHYRHLEERSISEKCLLLMEDVLQRLLPPRPDLLDHAAHEFLSHLLQHPSCFVSYAFFLRVLRHHPTLLPRLPLDRLRRVLQKVVSCFQEAGEIKFLRDLPAALPDWELSRANLEDHLARAASPPPLRPHPDDSTLSLSKIPPLILPSSKSIHSSRYSAISREEGRRGVAELRELGRAMGESFIGVELGCLLAHKRTQQVQEFSDNSEYRSKCLMKAETERMLSSRLSMREAPAGKGLERQMEETNRKHYRKVLGIHTNILHLYLQTALNDPAYDPHPLITHLNDYIDLAQVGIIEFSEGPEGECFHTIKLELLPVGRILSIWGERISFITEKRHLRMLWNRNKKNAAYSYEQGRSSTPVTQDSLLQTVEVTRIQHLKVSCKKVGKPEKAGSDCVVAEVAQRLSQLFGQCDMSSPRFYKYEANLLGVLSNYLTHAFSSTVQYLAIDLLFPLLLLVKRQLVELSHPYLSTSGEPLRRFAKKSQPERVEPLSIQYPELLSSLLGVVGGLMSNQKHVEKLLSSVFIKSVAFMEVLQHYVKWLFAKGRGRQIGKVLQFYRTCLQTYNQRKLRNQQSKSIKMLFDHLAGYFYPRVGCIANYLEEKQHLLSGDCAENDSSEEGGSSEREELHVLLQFVKDVYYYCQDELAEQLLQQQVAAFYIKYSLLNFIKLYSFLTVSELANLQQGNELTTKESPHLPPPPLNTLFMIDFIRLLTSVSVNRTQELSRKIKQYRILEFFVREFELEFEVAENIEKYVRKVTKIREVPLPPPPLPVQEQPVSSKHPKIPTLNLKADKFKMKTSGDQSEERSESRSKKPNMVPSLKLPTRSDRSQGKEGKGVLDGLLQSIKQKPKKGVQLNLQLGKLNLQRSGQAVAKSSERDLIYSSQRKIRKIYSNKTLHSQAILLVLSLLLNKGLLDPEYCDQFPITHGKINVLYILHHHLNEESNRAVIPILAEAVAKIKPYLAGQRLLKLLSTNFTDLSHYKNWKKISAGAYGVIYSCQTNIEEPRQVAIKQMNFPRSVYERCVLHDIFTEITCLENFRLDERITTMYNYGVVGKAYIIVMKKYDCSLRDWILLHRPLPQHLPTILRLYSQVLNIVHLLHDKSVTHYDIKADNILLQIDPKTDLPTKVVLADFGECRIFDQSKEELDMKSRGTECIKSPEMLTLALHLKKEADNYDRRKKIGTTRASDIWSLGCLFYEMLTGEYLFHRADWVNFYVQVTSPTEEVLNRTSLERLEPYTNASTLIEYLRSSLVRDPQHRPEIKSMIQKFKDLFGDLREAPPASKSPLVVQKDVEALVGKYMEEINKQENREGEREREGRDGRALVGTNSSKSNKFMRIMEDIFFCENVHVQEGGYEKIKQLKITHIITTQSHPLLAQFNTLLLKFTGPNNPNVAFRLAPQISDLLREVLLLKGRLLFINDRTNYATNLLIYTLSYWFRCSVYQTWCLINTQILLFPTFTSDLLALSSALRILNDIEQRVEELPKLQCICGSVTFILKELHRAKKKPDLNCRCKRKKLNEYSSNSPAECLSTGCQQYLEFVKKRYSICWQSVKWGCMHPSSLLTTAFGSNRSKDALKTQILLNSSQPLANLMEMGSCVKGSRVWACRVCEMVMAATTDGKEELLLVMNNMLRRIRQGIMIPNAQESFAKKTPALTYYTLTKLHMTKSPEE